MSRYWRSLAIRVGGSALMLALLLHFLPFQKLAAAVKSVSPLLGLSLIACYLSVHLLGAAKWRILINLAGARLTYIQAIRCYYLGLFGNIFLPSLVGGDFVRAGLAFRLSRNKPAIVLGSLIDRVQDMIGLLTVAGIGALMLPRALDNHSRRVFWVVSGLLIVSGLAALGAVYATPVRRFPFKVRRIMARVRSGIRSTYVKPHRVLLCFCLGITIQTCLVGINFVLAEALGLHVAFYVWLFAWPLSKLSGLVPVTQGGIGVREVALVALMSPFGAPAVLTAAVGLVFEAILITGGLIGGLLSVTIRYFSIPDTPGQDKHGRERTIPETI
ncbi:MAG: lysylphosphatidylglycerol synthase transmembrane domain-containing protein [Terriglobia bacterium]